MVFQVCVVSHTWKSGTPIERSVTKPPTPRCTNMLAPGTPNSSLLSGCSFRCVRFCAPGKRDAIGFRGTETVRQKAFICTKWSKVRHWYRKRTSGVPTKAKGLNTRLRHKILIKGENRTRFSRECVSSTPAKWTRARSTFNATVVTVTVVTKTGI